jgi:hypothetical protein
MRNGQFWTGGFSLFLLVACGGQTPPPEEPTMENTVEEPTGEPPPIEDEAPKADEEEGKAETPPPKKEAPEPEFKENGTVDEAIAAVPPGTERLNIDQETLGKPLQDIALYEPCKLPPSAHFKLRVAVWNGKAVGLDLTSTPKNPKLEECIKGRIRELTWRDRVRALNTVEYQF